MNKAVIRGGIDAWVDATSPNRERPRSPYLRVTSGVHETFVYLRSPAPADATVTSATVRMTVRNSSGTARNLTIRPVSEKWNVRRVNWNNRPATAGAATTVTVPAGHDEGYVVEFDVTAHVQSVTDGADHFGWKITSDDPDTLRFYAFQAGTKKPKLDVEWSDAPSAPSALSPDEGAVGTTHPTLTFDYTDVSGATDLAAVQVQIDPASDEATPAFDSGEVASVIPELDLSGTAYAGVAAGATTYWRVRVKDAAGLWSEWSEWATLTHAARDAVTITNPADIASPYVTEPTPSIAWTFPGVQTAWMVRITPADERGVILYSSGKRPGTATTHTLPEGVLKDDRAYSVNVRVWDDQDREATPGEPVYSGAWRDFVMDDDAATAGAETLTATVPAGTPWVDLTWTRSTMPDGFAVYRDGVVVAVLDPADVFVSGTTYTWRDGTASPLRDHTWSVRAVVNGKQSEPGPTATARTSPEGVWLADLERDVVVTLAGDDEGTWTWEDAASVYTPLGASESVRIVGGVGGATGSLSGVLIDGYHGQTFADQETALWDLKARPSTALRLVAGDVNYPVVIGNVSVAPRPVSRDGDIVKAVAFDFWQVGELPFEARL